MTTLSDLHGQNQAKEYNLDFIYSFFNYNLFIELKLTKTQHLNMSS